MDLINRATYRTASRIMLKSKRKWLHEDPEAWFVSNIVAAEHYKKAKTPIPVLISEFEHTYKGEDAADRVRYLLDLGKRLYAAFYGTPGVSDEDLDAPSGDSWCHECDKMNYSFLTDKWCPHRTAEPSERKEYVTWCERCKQFHHKVIPIGGAINLDAVCPLYGVIIPPKEIVTFDDDMGVVDEVSEGLSSGGAPSISPEHADSHPGELGGGERDATENATGIQGDVRSSGGVGDTTRVEEEIDI